MLRWLTPRVLVWLWLLGFSGSFLVQSALQSWFAAHSCWGPNPGWQTEIAIWNLGVSGVLLGVLRTGIEARVLPGLFVLSLCFGTNHVLGCSHASLHISHIAGASTNFAAVLLCLVYWARGVRG